jgi:hypothetical protein
VVDQAHDDPTAYASWLGAHQSLVQRLLRPRPSEVTA